MSDFTLVDPQGWEFDLQSVYSAYIGHFQLHNIAWYDKSWASLFANFEAFLAFGWPVIVVTDAQTARAHIVTRPTSVGAFLKMVKTRFGESLPTVANILRVEPFETSQRHLRTVADAETYRRLYNTLPAASLSALKARIRAGEHDSISRVWAARDRYFLAVSSAPGERTGVPREWGYAALRAPHVDTSGIWPPDPLVNYRKGHYVAAEGLDRATREGRSRPRDYAWAETHTVPRARMADIIGAMISNLASPESETQPNSLVFVAHGASAEIERLAEMKIKLPSNVFIFDTGIIERQMCAKGLRPQRQNNSALSLSGLMRSLDSDLASRGAPHHNAGNDAFATMLALQTLMGDAVPSPRPPYPRAIVAPAPSPLVLPLAQMQAMALGAPSPLALGTPSPLRTPSSPAPRSGELRMSQSYMNVGAAAHGSRVAASASQTLGRVNGKGLKERERSRRASAGPDEMGFMNLRQET